MVSKSTKRKHRRNKNNNAILKSVIFDLIDRRFDFWVISVCITENRSRHVEVYGYKKALLELRRINSSLWKAIHCFSGKKSDTLFVLRRFELIVTNRY